MRVKIKKLHEDAIIPKCATPGSSGFDLVAVEDVVILPGETKLIKTGFSIEIPNGFEMQVRPRSGISLKTPLRVSNSPGTVDADFRGQVCVIIENTFTVPTWDGTIPIPWNIKKGDRIAQGVICPVIQPEFEVVEELSSTERGAGGFGSSGT